MKHPTPEQLQPLLNAIDTAAWAWAVKQNTIKGRRLRVDWKGAIQYLVEVWEMFQLSVDDSVLVESKSNELFSDAEGSGVK